MSPGAATHDSSCHGGARAGSRTPSIPRCGISSPFRGHLSTKSNAFCIGQSSRLSDQYRVRDHMLIHYNKILSAKAAVDCSVPKSMMKSIKYSDQQRRERMKKEVDRLERTSSHSASSSRPHSRDGIDSMIHRKDPYEPHSSPFRHSPYSDPGPIYSPCSFISSPRHLRSPAHTGELHGRHPQFSRLHSDLSNTTAWSSPCKFQDNQTKTYNGDLLEKHSHHFNKERPFTPRTLKTQAKSTLAQSRYYTPPRRKRRGAEAETQTDLSSFQCTSQTMEGESSAVRNQVITNEDLLLSDGDEEGPGEQYSFSRLSPCDFKSPSPTLRKIHSEVLDQVFQRHLEENRHRLDEGKMQHLLDILRADLDFKEESPLKSSESHSSTRGFTSSSWDEVINGSTNEEASSFLITAQRVKSLPYMDEKAGKLQLQVDALTELDPRDTEQEHGESVPISSDDQHKNDSVQMGHDRGDLAPQLSHENFLSSLDDTGLEDNKGSTEHEDDHLEMLKEPPEDNLQLETSDSHQNSKAFQSSSNISKNTDDFETLEELKSFADVVQVSKEDDNSSISDPEEDWALETNNQTSS
ncbi:spermatogenesis-associated protein 7 isoform X3 [Engystomops pustulosus]|uniref:spermatogenesis-associated protein 7 isoform X3 n=1 Tax=Engystomops pustulosus TaxID=76066 RepID=UPI003AFAF7AF